MKISANGLNLIKQFEGCRLKAYKCVSTEKYYTIGYGHYGADVSANMTITQEQADAYLLSDIAKFEKYVDATELLLNQNQFDALVSFTYNCGQGNLKKLIANRTLSEIADALTLYNKSGGKVLTGLVRRRAAEQKLFNTPVSGSSVATPTKRVFVVGKNYTLQANMNVRITANGNKKPFDLLSANAKKNGYPDNKGFGILKKGTVVTCKEVAEKNNATWIRIPSGWVCAVTAKGKVYIK